MSMASDLSLEAVSNDEVSARQAEPEENRQGQQEMGSSAPPRDERALRRSWLMFACGHSLSMSGADYAASLVNAINITVYRDGDSLRAITVVLGCLVSSVFVQRLGPKRSILIGCVLFGVFAAASSAALMTADVRWQWILYVVASISCGWAVPVLAAAYGSMLDRTAGSVCQSRGDSSDDASRKIVSADLIANFEIVGKAISLVIPLVGMGLTSWKSLGGSLHAGVVCGASVVYCLVGAIAASRCIDPPPSEAEASTVKGSFRALGRFYAEPRAWMLATGALAMGGYSVVRDALVAPIVHRELGSFPIMLFGVIGGVCGLIVMKIVQAALHRSHRIAVLTCGSGTILLAVILAHFTDLAYRGWWALAVFSIINCTAWPCFEIGMKATMSEHFQGDQAAPAFASMTMQLFLVQAVFSFASNYKEVRAHVITWFVVFFASLIVPLTILADHRLQAGKAKAEAKAAEGRPLEDEVTTVSV